MKRWEWYSSLRGTFFTAASYSFATNSAVNDRTMTNVPVSLYCTLFPPVCACVLTTVHLSVQNSQGLERVVISGL